MANTALMQAVVRALMEGRPASPIASDPMTEIRSPIAPVPLAPTGNVGPLQMDTSAALAALAPQPVPAALPSPVDTDAIRARFSALVGPEPVAPVAGPDPLVLRIARALQGFGAGVQGQGPQFLESLRQEREAPMREFRAQKERFDTRKQELGLLAEQEIGRAQDRNATRTQSLLDQQSDREFEAFARRLNIQDKEVERKAREVFELNKLREQERIADEKLERQQKALDDRQRRAFEYQLVREDDAPSKIAREIADYVFSGRPMSPAAEKWRSLRAQTTQARLGRLSGSGGRAGVSEKAETARQQFEAIKQQVIDAEQRNDITGAEQLRKKMINIHNSLASRFPSLFELGYGDREGRWPYAKYRGDQGAQPQGAPAPGRPAQTEQMYFDLRGGGPSVGPGAQQPQAGPSDAEVQAYAQAYGVTPQVARQELMELRGQR